MAPLRSLALIAIAAAPMTAEEVLEPPTSTPGNYDRLAVGHFGMVEEGALVARGFGPEAAWYNPAGLAGERGATLSANASLFEVATLELSDADSRQSGFNMFPAFVGNSFPLTDPDAPEPWVMGLALVTTEDWDQNVSLFETSDEAGGTRTVGFESASEITTLVPTAALAWRPIDQLDVGVQIGIGYTTYDDLRTRNTRLLDGSGTPTETVSTSSRLQLEAWALRIGLGAQWRAGPRWRFGATLHAPAIQIYGSGDVTFDLFADNPDATLSARLREDDIDVEIRTPVTAAIGAAYVADRWEVELDVAWYADPGDYSVFEIGEELRLDVVPKMGGSAFSVTETLDASASSNRATVKLAIGGRYKFNEVYHGHAGFSYNASPVDASNDDSAFRDIDLVSLGLGVSRNGDSVSTVIGLRISGGEDDSIEVEDLVTGDKATVGLKVSLLTFGVSTAYRF